MRSEVVDVLCFVFPDGSVFHAEQTDALKPASVVQEWKDRHPDHAKDSRLLGGLVQIRMLRDDYQSIPATTESAAIFSVQPGGKVDGNG